MTKQGIDGIEPAPHRLRYKKGDLIVKEGDYGISMYKVLSGKVQVLVELEDTEIPLTTISEGDVIGEMVFLSRSVERRTATARALEETVLEVWHPNLIAREYEEMPPVLKLIADQTLSRLKRMNRLVPHLISKRRKEKASPGQKDPWASQRRFYRKKVDLRAHLRAVEALEGGRMEGTIKDISLGGAGIEIRPRNVRRFPYKEGHSFEIETILPNGKPLHFSARIVSVKPGHVPGTLFLGMSITDIDDQSGKDLGFFLMPA
ncbi:MAG: cyclic nucleotide-binding domain-containing protein [Deltaproteobacteria bacterium]|nr:cyclic nucleotide-binding domain-containing protein [Deltaproteobacteria bacterium]MBW2015882.1 cyclic nucleotide-binding domain-containing protein [Deltaproteobacteria bacterium]MBW2129636.1 cyclic nucleotide-binding domain-containing protein [Deltaproteobacteria bacterium]MBW2303941.1 cyclic nucleotide-binding domain-containing protein [Deltaproteobacteria bacterium]